MSASRLIAIKPGRRLRVPPLKSSGLSVLVLVAALSVLWLGNRVQQHEEPMLSVREISVTAPPPPPPPPPAVQQPVQPTPVTLQIQGEGPALPMLSARKEPLVLSKPDAPVVDTRPSQWQSLEVNWNALGLDQLDSMPNLLTPLRVTFPRSLSRRGITSVTVKLEILIDQHGAVTLISVVENPYPELQPEIRRIVRDSRFSAPMKDGQPARARFIWPVEISQ